VRHITSKSVPPSPFKSSNDKVPADSLITISEETLKPELLYQVPSSFLTSGTVWNSKCLLFYTAKFGIVHYVAICNQYRSHSIPIESEDQESRAQEMSLLANTPRC
jgi:hypothetical protein